MVSDIFSANAWVINKRPSGDTSFYITFFTREKGLINVLSRGSRSIKKQSLLQLFNPLWISCNIKYDRFYVNQVELIGPSLYLHGDTLFAALYINELLQNFLQPLDENVDLYSIYEDTIYKLERADSRVAIEVLLRKFERALLEFTGYGLSLTYDAETKLPIKNNCQYKFIPGLGVVIADKGILATYLHAIENDDFSDLNALKAAKLLMRSAIDYSLSGKNIKSRSLYIDFNCSEN